MHRNSVFLLFIIFLFSCKSDRLPEGIIGRKEMADLLVDVHLADGAVYMTAMPDSINKYGMGLYKAVFNKHKVDSVTFRKSFQYYAQHPVDMDKIYANVMKVLQHKQDSVTKVMRVADSTRTARAGDSIKRKLKADSIKNARSIDSAKRKKQHVLPR